MKLRQPLLVLIVLLVSTCSVVTAQQKLLTLDDLYDPAKKVNFNGTVPNIRWLKDGTHYLLANDPGKLTVALGMTRACRK